VSEETTQQAYGFVQISGFNCFALLLKYNSCRFFGFAVAEQQNL